jgi:nucleoid DNA-binding protein
MPKNVTKKDLVASIVANTGVKSSQAKKSLETVIQVVKQGLKYHGCVDLGRLGKLKAKKHPEKRYICTNLKQGPNIRTKYTKPTIRLHSKLDLSENPQPTIVHRNPKPEPVSPRRFAIARPSFRGRPNMPRRRA